MEGMSALQWLSMVACRDNPCPFLTQTHNDGDDDNYLDY